VTFTDLDRSRAPRRVVPAEQGGEGQSSPSRDPLPRVAFVYDFDGTLAPGNLPEHLFLPELGLDSRAFWDGVKDEACSQDADEILTYMRHMLTATWKAGRELTCEDLRLQGTATPLFDGVTGWFDRAEAFAADLGLALEHYVVSSGLQEMIEGCSVAARFRHVFASRYAYDDQGCAQWPAVAVNHTNKTQYLFRINKGVLNCWDDSAVNAWLPESERAVPFENLVFFGDGETDIPSMKLVTEQGGHSVAVFSPEAFREERTQRTIQELIAADRVDFIAPADYRDGSQLDVLARGILGRLANRMVSRSGRGA